jgi:hypothetical protein
MPAWQALYCWGAPSFGVFLGPVTPLQFPPQNPNSCSAEPLRKSVRLDRSWSSGLQPTHEQRLEHAGILHARQLVPFVSRRRIQAAYLGLQYRASGRRGEPDNAKHQEAKRGEAHYGESEEGPPAAIS